MKKWFYHLPLYSITFLCAWTCVTGTVQAAVLDVLCNLQQRSEESSSDAVLVLRQGRPFFDYHKQELGTAFDSQEITKSLISLTIMLLIDDGSIHCLDLPVKHFFPEWNSNPYSRVTIRQLLNNTSGLDASPLSIAYYRDPVQQALKSPLLHQPGCSFYRNNMALHLLLGIIKKASGKEFQDYVGERLFAPLGITNAMWRKSELGVELPRLVATPHDLAKIGHLIASKGMWCGKRILAERWLYEMASPSQGFDPFFGFQWWLEYYDIAVWWDEDLLRIYQKSGVSPDLVHLLRCLDGRVVHFGGQVFGTHIIRLWGPELVKTLGGEAMVQKLLCETLPRGLPLARFKPGKVKSIIARGKEGQQLIIMPDSELVAVRLKGLWEAVDDEYVDTFEDLPDLLDALSRECDSYID